MKLTLEWLKNAKSGEVIATGTAVDGPLGINMTNSGKMIRWAAFRGQGYHDWAIYCHWEGMSVEYIHDSGDKVTNHETIKKLVPCDDEAFAMYRH